MQVLWYYFHLKFQYISNGQKLILSKDEMRKEGIKSPDRSDALMMGVFFAERTFETNKMPQYGKMDADLLHPAYAEGMA